MRELVHGKEETDHAFNLQYFGLACQGCAGCRSHSRFGYLRNWDGGGAFREAPPS